MKDKISAGNIYPTNKYGSIKVLSYTNSKTITILFLDTGTKSTARADHIRSGSVQDPSLKIPLDMKPGTIHETNGYGEIEIISSTAHKEVKVKFIDTGYICSTRYGNIRKGSVKDKLRPNVYGVGFIGEGAHLSSNSKLAYEKWCDMLMRCYSEKYQEKQPTYNGCSVCKAWHNFQNFAVWYNDNYPKDGESYALDKDLKKLGNKIYSPDNCLFVSQSINNFLCDSRSNRGNAMIGASFFKRDGTYEGYCNNPFTGKKVRLGYYKTELQAHLAWRKLKSSIAFDLAKIQNNNDVRDSLLRYKKALDTNIIQRY